MKAIRNRRHLSVSDEGKRGWIIEGYPVPMLEEEAEQLAQANEKIKRVEEAFNWCLENEAECEGTKYEDDAVFDNWSKMKRVLSELEVNNEDV